MISVGVDVSKGKSTICVLKPYGEIVCSPFEVLHVEKELEGLDNLLQKLDGEIRIVMEATGIYHLPILSFLQEKGYFVSVVNPYAMKKYAKDNSIRGAKTDRLDSSMILLYGTPCESAARADTYPGLRDARHKKTVQQLG